MKKSGFSPLRTSLPVATTEHIWTNTLPKRSSVTTRYRRPLSLLLTDIDHFKRVNDSYGHQAGDLVLRHFVATIGRKLRKDVDWIARYGGEEFLIVLPETDFESAMVSAERLRKGVY
jgi:two-component system cell cycle response regulator